MSDKNRLHRFTVEGCTRFPLDMLRYDVCVPIGPEDIGQIEASLDDPHPDRPRTVALYAKAPDRRCTVARWVSFGWIVKRGETEGGERWEVPK